MHDERMGAQPFMGAELRCWPSQPCLHLPNDCIQHLVRTRLGVPQANPHATCQCWLPAEAQGGGAMRPWMAPDIIPTHGASTSCGPGMKESGNISLSQPCWPAGTRPPNRGLRQISDLMRMSSVQLDGKSQRELQMSIS